MTIKQLLKELKDEQEQAREYCEHHGEDVEEIVESDNSAEFEAGYYHGIQVAINLIERG